MMKIFLKEKGYGNGILFIFIFEIIIIKKFKWGCLNFYFKNKIWFFVVKLI